VNLAGKGEVHGRYMGDAGEIQGDVTSWCTSLKLGEIQGRCRGDTGRCHLLVHLAEVGVLSIEQHVELARSWRDIGEM
jgi:hypothetical protein